VVRFLTKTYQHKLKTQVFLKIKAREMIEQINIIERAEITSKSAREITIEEEMTQTKEET
jgi:hypothetical protein